MSTAQGANFGLFAGSVKNGAEFKNVTIDGKIIIGDDCEGLATSTGHSIRKVTGIGSVSGVMAEITVEKANPANESFNIEIDGDVITIVKVTE